MQTETEYEEKREFLRIDYEKNLNFREVKVDKFGSRTEIFTRNVSAAGLLFRTSNIPPALSSIIWIELDSKLVNICAEIEQDLVIKNGGVFGRVVRIAEGDPGLSYDVGVCFLRRRQMSDREVEELLPAA